MTQSVTDVTDEAPPGTAVSQNDVVIARLGSLITPHIPHNEENKVVDRKGCRGEPVCERCEG